MKKIKLIKNENQFALTMCDGVFPSLLTLESCMDRDLLISPDSRKMLKMIDQNTLGDGEYEYSIKDGSPILYSREITNYWEDGSLPFSNSYKSLAQYALLSQIKQTGEINAPLNSIPAQKHQWRFRDFCRSLSGVVLDVGSDQPSQSIRLLPSNCEYLGLDPYAGHGEFRIIGMGEVLPIRDTSIDAILFNTSLDHILDYHTAIDEACRVLKPGGCVVIATYVWIERASLLTDAIHFHHFREHQILGLFSERFDVSKICRYEDPKNDTHRYGLYVMAIKRN